MTRGWRDHDVLAFVRLYSVSSTYLMPVLPNLSRRGVSRSTSLSPDQGAGKQYLKLSASKRLTSTLPSRQVLRTGTLLGPFLTLQALVAAPLPFRPSQNASVLKRLLFSHW